MTALGRNVRSYPESRHSALAARCLLCANNELMQCSRGYLYSITSSAWASNVGETVRPSDFAVFILMTTWNLVGCSTGKLAGWVPLMILSTYGAVRS